MAPSSPKAAVHRRSLRALLVVCLVGLGPVAWSDQPTLDLPVDCTPHVDCAVQNYFDHAAGRGFADYRCGSLGYDGHDGTDIRVANLATMSRGITVLAAAPGTVRAIRDRVPDINVREGGRDAISGIEAGNAVVLRHGDDWETQYSHLRRGSVQVKPGQHVEKGQPLGEIGLSGNTEFPHLHFEVRYRGTPIDPFVGLGATVNCDVGQHPLWSAAALDALRYRATGLLQAGFATAAPDRRALSEGPPRIRQLPTDAPALVFWIEIYGAQAGDREHVRLTAPDGRVVAERHATIGRAKARWSSYAGRKRPAKGWPPGIYRAVYELKRETEAGEISVLSERREVAVR